MTLAHAYLILMVSALLLALGGMLSNDLVLMHAPIWFVIGMSLGRRLSVNGHTEAR